MQVLENASRLFAVDALLATAGNVAFVQNTLRRDGRSPETGEKQNDDDWTGRYVPDQDELDRNDSTVAP